MLDINPSDIDTACSMDEVRDGCRHAFLPLVKPMIANASTTGAAALLVNKNLWSIKGYWDIHFEPNQTPEYMSPTQVGLLTGFICLSGLNLVLN